MQHNRWWRALRSMVVVELHKGASGLVVVCANDRVERCGCALIENSDTIEEMTHKPKNTAVATYPSVEGDMRLSGAFSNEGKARGVATNIYSRKRSEKPKWKRSRVCVF